MLSFILSFLALNVLLTSAQQVAQDPGVYGPALQTMHLFYDEWPTGIAVSSTGRMFANYPPGLDPMDSNYTVAELTTNTTETPYPSLAYNTPPAGRINLSTYPATCVGDPNHLIGVQSVVIDPADRLWILDTGRAALPNGTLPASTFGGPKLVGIDLSNNSIFATILFPATVAFPDSYLNDVRFDLRPSLTPSGKGVAYITDSSSEGRNGIVIVDLGTGTSWRHLNNVPSVRPEPGFFLQVWGTPVYSNPGMGQPITPVAFGADGITLSADGATLYYSVVSGRYLFGVPTALLRSQSPTAELMATGAVQTLTQKGVSDGLESDSNGLVYAGSVETNSIVAFNPANGTVQTFVRDPRIDWTDTMSVSTDGYLYFTENQLFRAPSQQGGVDLRVRPFVLYRVPLPNGGKKIELL